MTYDVILILRSKLQPHKLTVDAKSPQDALHHVANTIQTHIANGLLFLETKRLGHEISEVPVPAMLRIDHIAYFEIFKRSI